MRGASAALAPPRLLCRRPRRGTGRDAARRARAGLPGRAAARRRAHVCRAHAARARRGGARRLARPQARPARLPAGRGPDARARAGRVPRGRGDHRARRAALAGAVGGRSAVLAAEDRHFFLHPGVDPVAIARALVADLRAHHVAQGASTLTQQLAKNAFLSPRRTLSRKLREAVLALLLEARASKEDILGRYVASVYLGVDGGLPVHGFSEAAQVYFGKPLGELEPAECALLAGIIRSPNGLSPRRRPRAALARRNRVLEVMVQDGLDKSVGA